MFQRQMLKSLTAGLIVTGLAAPLPAAVISVAEDGTLADGDSTSSTTADGNGESVDTFNNLITGPRDDGNNSDGTYSQENRPGVVFDISGDSSAIANDAQILLDVTTSASDNNFESGEPSFNIELLGLDSSDGTLTASDFGASATNLATIARADIAADTTYSLDVTSFVKAAESNGDSNVEFRLQADSFTGTPDNSSGLFVTRFDSDAADGNDTSDAPQLRTIAIPEPASAALLGLGGLMMLTRQRRGRKSP